MGGSGVGEAVEVGVEALIRSLTPPQAANTNELKASAPAPRMNRRRDR